MRGRITEVSTHPMRGSGFPGLPNVTLTGSSCLRSTYEISASDFVLQENDWSCGIAVFRMACLTFGISPGSFRENMMLLGTSPSTGTAQLNLLHGIVHSLKKLCHIKMGHSRKIPSAERFVWENGYGSPQENRSIIENLLRAENLVIVNYREPEERVGHYAIVQAISPIDIELADPWHGRISVLPLDQFDWRSGSPDPASTINGWYVALRSR